MILYLAQLHWVGRTFLPSLLCRTVTAEVNGLQRYYSNVQCLAGIFSVISVLLYSLSFEIKYFE